MRAVRHGIRVEIATAEDFSNELAQAGVVFHDENLIRQAHSPSAPSLFAVQLGKHLAKLRRYPGTGVIAFEEP